MDWTGTVRKDLLIKLQEEVTEYAEDLFSTQIATLPIKEKHRRVHEYSKYKKEEFNERVAHLLEWRDIWSWDKESWYKENIEPLSHIYIDFKIQRTQE